MTPWDIRTTPRRQGRSAYIQGSNETDNPYENGTSPFRQWLTGFAVERRKRKEASLK